MVSLAYFIIGFFAGAVTVMVVACAVIEDTYKGDDDDE